MFLLIVGQFQHDLFRRLPVALASGRQPRFESKRCCAQHPDLVEKRRKAFGDNLRTYLVSDQAGVKAAGNGSTRPGGVNGMIREDEPGDGSEGAGGGDGDGSERHSDSYNLRRRGTAPA